MSPRAPNGEQNVLSFNVGSSSLKFALYAFSSSGAERQLALGAVERIGAPDSQRWLRLPNGATQRSNAAVADQAAAIAFAFEALHTARLPEPHAVGHRLVHGGPEHVQPARVADGLLDSLRAACKFAPLHLPAELRAIELVTERSPALPQVVCFDTAFHAGLPEVARRLPLTAALDERGVRRYGFHGLSYEYVVSELGAARLGRAVLAHLGSGASLAAVHAGRPIDTTMGLTPTGGIMMGTRSGDLDPGVLLYLLGSGYDARKLEQLLEHEAGLRGVSGTSSDVQALIAQRAHDPSAALALAMFAYQVRKTIGAFAAALGGIDNLVFTGGIGEHAASVRSEACRGLDFLGIQIDAEANARSAPVISAAGAACTVHVTKTNEALMIARHAHRLLSELPPVAAPSATV